MMHYQDTPGEFAELAAAIMLGRKNMDQARLEAQRLGVSGRVSAILRDATVGTSSGWGAELVDYETVAASFLATLTHASVFDTLLPDMVQLPTKTRAVATILAPVANIIAEGGLKTVSELSLADGQIDEHKAAAIIVLSEELLRLANGGGVALLQRELRQAVASQTDAEFISIITNGIMPIASVGSDADAVFADVKAGLDALNTGDASRVHIIVSPSTAKALTTMPSGSAMSAFPDATLNGGGLLGIPLHVSDALEPTDSPETSSMIFIDCAQVAAGAGIPMVASAGEALITSGEVVFNLFQDNLRALRVERTFGAEVMRSGAVSVVDGVAYSWEQSA